MSFDLQAASKHAFLAVQAAPLSTEPFAHLIIGNLLPDQLYDEIIERWPDLELFTHTNSFTRYELRFRAKDDRLSEAERDFWRDVTKVFRVVNRAIQSRLAPHFGEKFAPYLGDRWFDAVGENVDCLPTSVQLATYTEFYRLAPHVDSLRLLTNAFVYFSEYDEAEPDLGTVLYRARGLAIPTNWTLEESDVRPFLDRVAVSAYQRNHCLAYVNSPKSFHGVDPHRIGDRHRRLLMFGSLLYIREIKRIFGQDMSDWIMKQKKFD